MAGKKYWDVMYTLRPSTSLQMAKIELHCPGGMTAEQMQGFFGWKNSSMCQEYISTSRPATMHAANLLGSFDLADVEVEEEDELPVDMVKDEEDDLSGIVLEEDPEMYEATLFRQPYSYTHFI